ncbi:hypothetical protein BGW38_005067 [Lunasporangiospora selenospora]|uniref:Major facilitator superfamily (MFS) profile domain-containing protein n=1 Tax=Lunasporangiospora selenospora TaxID=979761 RepID=A0A9P6G070_9FUNG|nr:hypothetical protein BGW38_005067 [Lunasporangiospora selenospora]
MIDESAVIRGNASPGEKEEYQSEILNTGHKAEIDIGQKAELDSRSLDTCSVHTAPVNATDADLEKGDPSKREPSTNTHTGPVDPFPFPFDDSSEDKNATKPFLYGLRTSKNYITVTILICLFTDMITYGIIIPLMPTLIKGMEGDSTKTGILVAVYAAGIMFASPVFGTISDKMASRRRPMILGLFGLLTATIIFMLAKVYWLLIIARFFQGVSGGAVWTLSLALMADTFPASELGVQMGKSLIGHTMGMLGGPPIGGLLYEAFGSRAPFYFCIAFVSLAIILLSCLIEKRADETQLIRQYEQYMNDKAIAQGIVVEEKPRISMWKLVTTKRMIAAVLITTLEAFDLASLEPTLPYYLRERFGMSEGQIGLVFIAFTMPTIVSPLAGWISDRYGAKILCFSAVTLCGCFMLILSIKDKPLWGITLTLVGVGLATASFIAPVLGEISAVVRRTGDRDGFARAFAIFNMSFSFGMLVGPILAGYIYGKHGFSVNNITTACFLFAALPIIGLWIGGRQDKMEDIKMYEAEEEERKRILSEISLMRSNTRDSQTIA